MINFTRRDFLIQTLADTQVLAVPMMPPGVFAYIDSTADARELLDSVLDTIIPKSDSLPSASDVGGANYLEQLGWQYPDIARDIEQFLGLVKAASPGAFDKSSPSFGPERMVEALKLLEGKAPDLFSKIVEAYYVQPVVTGLIACPVPIEPGTENDQALLTPVRASRHVQREVP